VLFVDAEDEREDVVARLDGGLAWGPVLSSDGALIAMSRKLPGQPWRIQTLPREGGTPTTVLDAPFDTIWPRFHPDGAHLLFFTWPGRQRIGMVALDGGGLRWLTEESGEAGYPSISPDGNTIAYVRGRGEGQPTDIVLRPLEGGEERVTVQDATLPAFSPDGRHLAFAGGRTPAGRIGVLDLETGERRWLTDSGTWPAWMPDGRAIAYAGRSEEGPQVARVVSLDGRHDDSLSDYRWSGSDYPFSIDPRTGRILATNSSGERSTIWLAEYDAD